MDQYRDPLPIRCVIPTSLSFALLVVCIMSGIISLCVKPRGVVDIHLECSVSNITHRSDYSYGVDLQARALVVVEWKVSCHDTLLNTTTSNSIGGIIIERDSVDGITGYLAVGSIHPCVYNDGRTNLMWAVPSRDWIAAFYLSVYCGIAALVSLPLTAYCIAKTRSH